MDGIDPLLNLLATVKCEGLDAAFSEGVYLGSPQSRNANFQAYPEPLRSFRRSLQDAKMCLAALNSITPHLKKTIRTLQKRCAPLVLEHAINSIPDDILAHIFEVGHQTSFHSKFALRVSHVSRRFRQVSLQTPLLWTRLSSQQPTDQTEAFILRSGRLDLQLILSFWCRNYSEKIRSCLHLIHPHSQRCTRLLLSMPRDQQIKDEFGLTYFPRLRYLFQDVPMSLPWSTPLLSQFDGSFSRTSLRVSLPFLSQLTCMELRFMDDNSLDMTSLAQILYRTMNLRDLSLEFHNCRDVNHDPDFGGPIPVLEAPTPHSFHIESLSITFRDSAEQDLVASLYAILAYLTASLVNVSLPACGNPYEVLTHGLFPRGFTVRLQIETPFNLFAILGWLLVNCKIVRSVQFETSSFNSDMYSHPNWSHVPSLRHLLFHDCGTLEEKHVDVLARQLLTGTDQFLEIISCKQISEEFLEDLQDEVGERLTWSL